MATDAPARVKVPEIQVEARPAPHIAEQPEDVTEISEHNFAMAIVRGVAIGMPVTFVIAMLIMWIGDPHLANWGAALWVSIVCGGFLGTVVTLNLELQKLHPPKKRA